MAYSYSITTAQPSQTDFYGNFPYLRSNHIKVYKKSVSTVKNWTLVSSSDYSIIGDNSSVTVRFNTAPSGSTQILIKRESQKSSKIVDFNNGSRLIEKDLDDEGKQMLYLIQETEDQLELNGVYLNNNNSPILGASYASFSTPIAVTFSNTSTFTNIPALFTSLDTTHNASYGVSNGMSNESGTWGLINTSGLARVFKVDCKVMVVGSHNNVIELELFTNGYLIGHNFEIHTDRAVINSHSDRATLNVSTFVWLPHGESIKTRLRNRTSTNTVHVQPSSYILAQAVA